MVKTVIVPLDGSEFARRAVAVAAALASRFDAELLLMTSRLGGVTDAPEAYLADVGTRAGITNFDTRVFTDRDARGGVVALTQDMADPLVCMSTHGRSGVAALLLGSVAEDVLRKVATPFVLVGPAVDSDVACRFDRLVVCTDGSDASRAIIPIARSWIDTLGIETSVLQVIDPELATRFEHRHDTGPFEERTVEAFVEQLESVDSPVDCDVIHDPHPAAAIVDYARAEDVSLIAMATHGRTGWARISLGSVTAAVVHSAPCPVLVMRPRALRV